MRSRTTLADHPAVVAGIVSERAAFCGLSEQDVLALAQRAPATALLVRFRNNRGDGRAIVTSADLASASKGTLTAAWREAARAWDIDDVMDVTLLSGLKGTTRASHHE